MGIAATVPAPGTVRVLVAVAGIYTIQSTIGGMSFQALPAVLRSTGAGLELVGLVSLFMLPWALKFLWAPAVERFRQRPGGIRRSRLIILGGQGLAFALLGLIALLTPAETPLGLFLLLAVVAVVVATSDIACDGFTVERLTPATRGWGGAVQVGGGYAGAMLGGGLFLVLVDQAGWTPAVLAMVGFLALLTLPTVFIPEPPLATSPARIAPHRPSLGAAFARADVRWGLVAVLAFQPGLRIVQGLMGPFLIDRGFDLTLLGMLHGGPGTVASLSGVLLGGMAARRWGADALLRPVVLIEAAVFLALLVAALSPALPMTVLIGLMLVLTIVTGAAFAILYTAMMGWTSLQQAGIDFTLFQCADAMVAALAGYGGALLAGALGYKAGFGLATAAALAAAVLLPIVLARIGSVRSGAGQPGVAG